MDKTDANQDSKFILKKYWLYLFLQLASRLISIVIVPSLTAYDLGLAIARLNLRNGIQTTLLAGDHFSSYITFQNEWNSQLDETTLRKSNIFILSAGGNHKYLSQAEKQIGMIKEQLTKMDKLKIMKEGILTFHESELLIDTVEYNLNSLPLFKIGNNILTSNELFFSKLIPP